MNGGALRGRGWLGAPLRPGREGMESCAHGGWWQFVQARAIRPLRESEAGQYGLEWRCGGIGVDEQNNLHLASLRCSASLTRAQFFGRHFSVCASHRVALHDGGSVTSGRIVGEYTRVAVHENV